MRHTASRHKPPSWLNWLWIVPMLSAGLMLMVSQLRAGEFGRGIFSTPTDALLEDLGAFYYFFLGQDAWLALAHLLVVALAFLGVGGSAGERLALAASRWRWWITLGALVGMSAGATWIYHAHPIAMDEYSPYLQAHIFAQGELAWQVDPTLLGHLVDDKFRNHFLAVDAHQGRIASMYWPGFAFLLTPFAWLGIPWLLNPLLTAGSLLLIHSLGQRMGENQAVTGGWALLLALASPVLWINGISFYSMPAHLAANLFFAWLVSEPKLDPGKLVAAGLVGALALNLHNPVPHILFALPWWIWLCWRKNGWRQAAWLGLGYLPLGVGIGWGWIFFLQDLSAYSATAVQAGISSHVTEGGKDLPLVLRVLQRMPLRWPDSYMLESQLISASKLWLWSVPGLLIWVGVGLMKNWNQIWVRLWGGSFFLTSLFYVFLEYGQGHGWGYRYVHPVWAALPLIAAACLRQPVGTDVKGFESRVNQYSARLILLTMALITPCQLWQTKVFTKWHISHRPDSEKPMSSQVFFINTKNYRYGSDLITNTPNNPCLYLISKNPANDSQVISKIWERAEKKHEDQRGSVWLLDKGITHEK